MAESSLTSYENSSTLDKMVPGTKIEMVPGTHHEKIQASLQVSLKEGVPASLMMGITDYYLIPFALFLGATTPEIGFLVALPNLMGSIAQLFAVRAVRAAGSRLRFIVQGAALQAALLIPAAGLALRVFPGRIGALIALMTGFRMVANLIGTAWGSLMSDYLSPEKRGSYFGWRSQLVGIAGVVGMGFGGCLLYFMKKISPALGFFILFFCASLFRFASVYLLGKMTDLPLIRTPGSDFTFLMFLRRFRESNFVKFILFVSSITFATHLAGPYFSVYMLRDLRFDYLHYMAVHLSAVISGLVAFPIWGRHADLVGNARILKLTSFGVPLVPFLWLISGNPVYLMMVEAYAGFVWCGFNLSSTNFIFDAVSPAKRVRCIGYFTLINGMSIFLGASLGGFLAGRLPVWFRYQLLTLVFLSGVLRMLAHLFLERHFREVRASVKTVSSSELFFSVVGIKPLVAEERE